jgi:hypothetical protein
MSSSKTWNGVTESIFDCVKAESEREHGTKYDPPNGDQGTATTSTPVGDVVLRFDLQPSGALTYTILKKPFLVSESQIWDGIADGLNACRA